MGIKSFILVFIGILSLGLGAVGLFLPIMPTTPFVLVSAACFSAGNKSLYNRLLNARYFGEFVGNYRTKNGIAIETKIKSIAFLWISLIISAVVFRTALTVSILFIVGIAVSAHILTIKTKR